MRTVVVTILAVCAARTRTKELTMDQMRYGLQELNITLVRKLLDKMTDNNRNSASPTHRTDLDGATLGKSSNLRAPYRTHLNSIPQPARNSMQSGLSRSRAPRTRLRALYEDNPPPDMVSLFFRDGVIFLYGPIDTNVAKLVVTELLYLANEDAKRGIRMFINSPGGELQSGLSIYDTMDYVDTDIATFCTGQAASVASLILAAGAKGQRAALPSSKVILRQVQDQKQGQAGDLLVFAKDILAQRDTIDGLLAERCGKTIEQIRKDSERDNYLTAEQALEYGLVDEIIASRKEIGLPADSTLGR